MDNSCSPLLVFTTMSNTSLGLSGTSYLADVAALAVRVETVEDVENKSKNKTDETSSL